MTEKSAESGVCPSCGYPSYAGHGPGCKPGEKKVDSLFMSPDEIEKKYTKEKSLPSFDRQLFEVAKKVASGESEGATASQAEFAHRYLEALAYEETQEENEELAAKFEKYVDVDMSDKLKEYILSGKMSLFQDYDKKMGVDDSNRKAFNIKVLRLSNKTNGAWTESEWGRETETPTLFVRGRDTIYISEEDAAQILRGEKFSNENTLVHEYRHTQRKFTSDNDRLLRIFDESATNVGMGYIQIRILLETLFLTTSDMRFNKVMNAYDNNDEKEKNNILQAIEKNFSPFGFLLLSSRPSSEHSGDQDGLRDAPFETDLEADCGGNEKLQFLEETLRFRARTDADWLQVFKNNIKGVTGKDFRRLEIIKSNWLSAYFKGVNNTKAEHVKNMVAAIEEVIADGIARGEESFYVAPLPKKDNSR